MPCREEAFTHEHYGVREFVGGHTGLEFEKAVYNPTANIAASARAGKVLARRQSFPPRRAPRWTSASCQTKTPT